MIISFPITYYNPAHHLLLLTLHVLPCTLAFGFPLFYVFYCAKEFIKPVFGGSCVPSTQWALWTLILCLVIIIWGFCYTWLRTLESKNMEMTKWKTRNKKQIKWMRTLNIKGTMCTLICRVTTIITKLSNSLTMKQKGSLDIINRKCSFDGVNWVNYVVWIYSVGYK